MEYIDSGFAMSLRAVQRNIPGLAKGIWNLVGMRYIDTIMKKTVPQWWYDFKKEKIYKAAEKYKVPVFSSSSLRYTEGAQDIAQGKTVGKVLGAEAFSPCKLEQTHPDLFWYGIHGVETLYTVMGTGCKKVVRISTDDTDVVVGTWDDNRIGTFRGIRSGKSDYGGTVYGEKAIAQIGTYSGYNPLLVRIIEFFKTGIAPVTPKETLEIYAFLEAAHESKRRGGVPVTLEEVMKKSRA